MAKMYSDIKNNQKYRLLGTRFSRTLYMRQWAVIPRRWETDTVSLTAWRDFQGWIREGAAKQSTTDSPSCGDRAEGLGHEHLRFSESSVRQEHAVLKEPRICRRSSFTMSTEQHVHLSKLLTAEKRATERWR